MVFVFLFACVYILPNLSGMHRPIPVSIAVLTLCWVLWVNELLSPVSSSGSAKHITACFDGYETTPEGLCLESVDEVPTAACPSTGFVEGRRCRVRVPKLKRCEEGYTLTEAGECSSVTLTNTEYFCPAGFSDDGDRCVKRLPGETRSYCTEGQQVDDKCVQTLRVAAEQRTACPDGSTNRDGRCWKVVDSFDCTGEFECTRKCTDPGCRNHPGRLGVPRRGLHGLSGLVPVSAPRPSKVNIVSQLCQRELELASVTTIHCPPGYIEESNQECSHEEYFPLTTKCVETDGPVSNCPPIVHTIPKQPRCPEGSKTTEGGCERVHTVKQIEYCPPQFTPADGSTCVGYIDAPLVCPSDLHMVNGRCVGTRLHPPIALDVGASDLIISGKSTSHASLGVDVPTGAGTTGPRFNSRPLAKSHRNRVPNNEGQNIIPASFSV